MTLTVFFALIAGAQSKENLPALKKILDAMMADERGPTAEGNLTPTQPCFTESDLKITPCPSGDGFAYFSCRYFETPQNGDHAWLCANQDAHLGQYKGMEWIVGNSYKVDDYNKDQNPTADDYLELRTIAQTQSEQMRASPGYSQIRDCPDLMTGTWEMHDYHFNFVRHEEPSGALWWGQTELDQYPFNCDVSTYAGLSGSLHPKNQYAVWKPHSILNLPCEENWDCNGNFVGLATQYNFQDQQFYCAKGDISELYVMTETSDSDRVREEKEEMKQHVSRLFERSPQAGICIDQTSCYAKLFGMSLKCTNENRWKEDRNDCGRGDRGMGVAKDSEYRGEKFMSLASALVASTATMAAAVAATI